MASYKGSMTRIYNSKLYESGPSSFLCIFLILVVPNFSFEGRTLVLIAPVPDRCLPFLFQQDSRLEDCCGHMNIPMHFTA